MGELEYMALDPGKRTGWATWDEEGNLMNYGAIVGEDTFLDWLEAHQAPRLVILEAYRNRPGTAVNAWSKGTVQQHIGAIKRILRKKKIAIVEQDPSPCLVQGLRFLGVWEAYKGRHVPDEISALAHGTYYLRKNRIQK